MLDSLRFKNFKTWREVDLRFGRITGLFGTNSSGKTSLIQFLLLLKQTKEATDRGISLDLNGVYVRLGVYKDMIHKHNERQSLSWSLTYSLDKDIQIVDPGGKRTDAITTANRVAIESEVVVRDQTAEAIRLAYTAGDYTFSLAPKATADRAFELVATGGEV